MDFLKYQLHQQHIADGSTCNGDQHLAFPDMKTSGNDNGDQLREPMTALKDTDIFQTVDHQHTKDSRWKIFPKILDKIRCFMVFIEDDKWQKTCGHCSEHT